MNRTKRSEGIGMPSDYRELSPRDRFGPWFGQSSNAPSPRSGRSSLVYTILDFLLDWIGRSTAGDDARQLLNEKLPAWAEWLFSTPSWVPAFCAIALTFWLMWLSRPAPRLGAAPEP